MRGQRDQKFNVTTNNYYNTSSVDPIALSLCVPIHIRYAVYMYNYFCV